MVKLRNPRDLEDTSDYLHVINYDNPSNDEVWRISANT
jgi:hypothetical protein